MNYMINKELLTKYAELKLQEKLIKNELEFLNEEVCRQVSEYIASNDGALPGVELVGGEIGITGRGKFSIKKLKTWKYSDFVKRSEEAIKDRKAEEQASGEATFEEKESVIFTQDKV